MHEYTQATQTGLDDGHLKKKDMKIKSGFFLVIGNHVKCATTLLTLNALLFLEQANMQNKIERKV